MLGCLAFCSQAEAKKNLVNDSFELPALKAGETSVLPAEWLNFASVPQPCLALTTQVKKSGMQSLHFSTPEPTNAYVGIVQVLEVRAGRRYEASCYVQNDPATPIEPGAYAQISIEWKDASNKEISRDHGPSWSTEVSAKKWERMAYVATAPKGAESAAVVITYFAPAGGGVGAFYLDKVDFTAKP